MRALGPASHRQPATDHPRERRNEKCGEDRRTHPAGQPYRLGQHRASADEQQVERATLDRGIGEGLHCVPGQQFAASRVEQASVGARPRDSLHHKSNADKENSDQRQSLA
jgi:hypothetical protein